MAVQLQQVVACVVWEGGVGTGATPRLHIRWVRRWGVCVVSLEAVLEGTENSRNGHVESAGVAEVEGEAPLPVEA